MFFELLFLASVILYVLTGKSERILYVLVFFLPFNAFIKSLLDYIGQDSALFSFWKEMLVTILLIANCKNTNKCGKLKTVSILYASYILLYFIVGSTYNLPFAIIRLRDYLFPIIILLAISVQNITPRIVRKLLYIFSISIFITCLIGFAETFGGLRVPIAVIKNAIVGVGTNGEIYYPAAWMIMGHNRMVGLLDSPNQLALLLSMYILVSFFFKDYIVAKNEKKFILVVNILATICLLLTFSRTAFALLVITYSCYLLFHMKKIGTIVYAITCLCVIFLVIFYTSEEMRDVVLGTITGQEASSADRGNNITKGIAFALSNPLGYGLGTTYTAGGTLAPIANFAESGLINLMIELGLIGLLLMSIYYIKIYNVFSRICKSTMLANFKYIYVATYICAWVSINPLEFIFTYYLMIFTGVSLSLFLTKRV